MESDSSWDLVKCDSCRTPMLAYYTTDKLMLYICPNCVDWSATENTDKNIMFIN